MSCVSVVIKNTNLLDPTGNSGTCVLAGDLFEKEEDVLDSYIWIEAGSEDSSAQRQNRLKVAKLADWIVPGHGPIFKVTDDILNKLEEDCQKNQF
jgi:glyoxylase-like metal-dependent hydrolase (beta-lactamase superfamily II)